MTDDEIPTIELRVTFHSQRAEVRDRVVIVEMYDVPDPDGVTLQQRALELAVSDVHDTSDLDGVAWTTADLLAVDPTVEVL